MPYPRKPTALHLIDGTVNVTRHRDRQEEPKPEGKPEKPTFLTGNASKLWDQYVVIGFWLTNADSHALAAWCGLTAELEHDLTTMTTPRIAQWRALAAELGFSPASRSRIHTAGNADKKDKNGSDKYYA